MEKLEFDLKIAMVQVVLHYGKHEYMLLYTNVHSCKLCDPFRCTSFFVCF